MSPAPPALEAGPRTYPGRLFVVEGIGLLLHKRWAEYFTVITTGLLMPIEIYELVHRPTILRAGPGASPPSR